jgi:hypothetical protein
MCSNHPGYAWSGVADFRHYSCGHRAVPVDGVEWGLFEVLTMSALTSS